MVNFVQKLFSKSKNGIGIELAPDRLNIMQLQKQRQGFKIAQFISEEVPEGLFSEGQIIDQPAMAELIDRVLSENKIKTKNIATAIPGRESVVRLVPVPAEMNDPAELRDYINQEAGLYLPFPREEADVDFQKLGSVVDEDGIEKVQVLLVATRRDITDSYIATFREAGLKLDIIEVSSFALLRTIRDKLQQFTSSEAAVLADVEFDSTEIAVVVDGVPQFSRTIPIGTFQIQGALSQAMNLPPSRNTELLQGMTIPVSPNETMGMGTMGGANPGTTAMVRILGELADEIRRSIDFYLNQSDGLEVAQLFVCGPGSSIGQLDEFFMQRLSLPTSQVDPIESMGIQVEEELIPQNLRSRLGVVLGLGIREI